MSVPLSPPILACWDPLNCSVPPFEKSGVTAAAFQPRSPFVGGWAGEEIADPRAGEEIKHPITRWGATVASRGSSWNLGNVIALAILRVAPLVWHHTR